MGFIRVRIGGHNKYFRQSIINDLFYVAFDYDDAGEKKRWSLIIFFCNAFGSLTCSSYSSLSSLFDNVRIYHLNQ